MRFIELGDHIRECIEPRLELVIVVEVNGSELRDELIVGISDSL